jgi:cobalt-zinc-cadmium efflux system outer membrane protein
MPENVQIADGLTEAEAISIALFNNAELQGTLAELGLAEGDLQSAGALPNPIFSFLFPVGPKQIEMALDWGIDWLWKRPYRVAAASLDVERVAEELVARGLDTVRDAQIAHADLALARKRRDLLADAAIAWDRVAQLARVRLEAGAASRLEVTAVESDARTAKLEEQRQVEVVRQREAQLYELMNPPNGAEIDLGSLALPLAVSTPPGDLERLIARGMAARPEVRAAELSIEAAGERSGVAVAAIFDFIARLDANGPGSGGFELGPGIAVALPIFDQKQGARTRAAAELERATWRYLGIKQRVEREVRVAYHRYKSADEALRAWPIQVTTPLLENVARAEQAYTAGGASYLEVLDATRRLIEARIRELDLEIEARHARAELQRSVGGMLDAE